MGQRVAGQGGVHGSRRRPFSPAGTTGEALVRTEGAKAICRSCPCCDACLAFAIETNQALGVWGGASEDDRRRMHRYRLTERRVLC